MLPDSIFRPVRSFYHSMTLDSDSGTSNALGEVLVTGGAGFMGSHTLDHLVQKYPSCNFTCIDKLSYATNHLTDNLRQNLDKKNFCFIKLDLAEEYSRLEEIIVESAFTTVIHFAAESCVDRSFEDPLLFTRNNVLGTQNLLECCRLLLLKNPDLKQTFRFIHISTDEVYGEQQAGECVNEAAQLRPSNPYAASKAACDLIIEAYRQSYKMSITILRSNNVYGPRQYPEKLIPVCLDLLQKAKPSGLVPDDRIPIHGDGKNRRRYLHVVDFANAVERLWLSIQQPSETEPHGQIFNVGSADEIDNQTLVEMICTNFMRRKFHQESVDHSKLVRYVKDRKYNDRRYSVDFSKISLLGWKQEVLIEEGISHLVEVAVESSSSE